MTTLTATDARKKWFDILKQSIRGHRVYEITSRDGGAVLLSRDDYDNLLETLELTAIPGFVQGVHKARREIKAGKTYSMEEVFGA
ncbi:MAG: type II toxin-antitoxin system Phd/YefM family antitoxin [Candidatus Omnitrophota bacterium]